MMASHISHNRGHISHTDRPPSYRQAQGSSTRSGNAPIPTQQFGKQLIFVETQYTSNASPAKVYRYPGTTNLFSNKPITNYCYSGPSIFPEYGKAPVEVISINMDQKIPEITSDIMTAMIKDNAIEYANGKSVSVELDGLSVAWQGQETVQSWSAGRNEKEVKDIFTKMAERDWQDHLVIFYNVYETNPRLKK
ncbi:hypothetical protein VTL71DRAFT_2885 [Oculimacula yallundae]|uniref:Uncharacterized protein n=1 Tax=Oculimacula yallundae TaxID=86028 RepID=A0ABR4C5L1_9HELO